MKQKGRSIANEFLRKGAVVSSFSSRKYVCTSLASIMGSSQSLLQPLPHLAGCPKPPVFAGRFHRRVLLGRSSPSSLFWKGALCQRPRGWELVLLCSYSCPLFSY